MMLTCKEAKKMVTPYIRDELSDPDLEAFLLHIRDCPDCMEDLEIAFTIDHGLLQLDDDIGEEDIEQALEESLYRSWLRIRAKKLREVICCVVDTLCATGVIVILIMQAARWLS